MYTVNRKGHGEGVARAWRGRGIEIYAIAKVDIGKTQPGLDIPTYITLILLSRTDCRSLMSVNRQYNSRRFFLLYLPNSVCFLQGQWSEIIMKFNKINRDFIIYRIMKEFTTIYVYSKIKHKNCVFLHKNLNTYWNTS